MMRRRQPMRVGDVPAGPVFPAPEVDVRRMQPHTVFGGLQRSTLVAERAEYPQILAPRDYPLVVVADATSPTVIEISAGHMYVIETLTAKSTGAFLCLIRDSASSIALMNKAIHSENLFGTAQRPGFMSLYDWGVQPHSGKRTFEFEITDLTGATNTIYFEMRGHRRREDPDYIRTQ